MRHIRLWTSAGIIAVVIFVSFVITVPHTRDLPVPVVSEAETQTIPNVSIRDAFKKGTHTITGSIMAPNPCTSVSVTAEIVGATSSQSILLSILMPSDAGVCLQIPVLKSFSTTMNGPSGLPIQATVNGISATTTLI